VALNAKAKQARPLHRFWYLDERRRLADDTTSAAVLHVAVERDAADAQYPWQRPRDANHRR